MTAVGFYHLQSLTLDRALPQLLEKAYAAGYRVVLIAGSVERVDHLNTLLWTFNDATFLPHGSAKDGNAPQQPIWLTVEDENPNDADMLVLVDGVMSRQLDRYKRVLDVFDGNDETAVASARQRWQQAKAAGYELTYWQQTEKGWADAGGG